MSSFLVRNFGCRASQADGAAIESQLIHLGYVPAPDTRSAEYIILNTCTVTATADDEMRQMVRRVHRENPQARIVVTGCYAQRAPEELTSLPGVAMVVGNSHKTLMGELISAPYHGEVHVSDIFGSHEFFSTPVKDAAGDRSRPNLKIQDGCNNRCSFCVIPYVRGRSRSAPVQQIVEQVREISSRYPEVVLTGINLGRWGREAGMQMRLSGLLRTLLAETDISMIRLSSVEPMDWSTELLELMADSPRIAKHIHAPLQSGSDAILRRMHRKYRPRHYQDRIRLARALMPDAAIGADVMAGFPGETEAEFLESLRFIEELPFTYLHVFPYSERPGTPAASRQDGVPWQLRKERGRILKGVGQAKNLAFRRSMIGKRVPAVTLHSGGGLTSNYLQVELAVPRPPRRLVEIEIAAIAGDGVREAAPFPILA